MGLPIGRRCLALPPRPYQHRESAYQVGVSKKKSEDRTLATLALVIPRLDGASLRLVALRQASGGDA